MFKIDARWQRPIDQILDPSRCLINESIVMSVTLSVYSLKTQELEIKSKLFREYDRCTFSYTRRAATLELFAPYVFPLTCSSARVMRRAAGGAASGEINSLGVQRSGRQISVCRAANDVLAGQK